MNIVVILGTRREGNWSQHAASLMVSQLSKQKDLNVTLVDPTSDEFPIGNDHQMGAEYKELAANADGFVVVYPEYNHSYPGTLKSILDGAYGEYKLKPFLLCGVSDGIFGGVRATEALLPVIKAFGAYAMQRDIYFTQINKTFDETGKLVDKSILETVEKRISELLELSEKFATLRD